LAVITFLRLLALGLEILQQRASCCMSFETATIVKIKAQYGKMKGGSECAAEGFHC
jgi:hypothetical protein